MKPVPLLALAVAALFVLALLTGASGFGVPEPLILWQIRLPRSAGAWPRPDGP